MSSSDSFVDLVSRLRRRDEDAASEVFRRFVRRLVALACGQFAANDQAVADPEGIVQSALGSFFTRLGRSQLDFDDWEQLWGLLVVITLRKCGKRRDYLRAQRRSPKSGAIAGLVDGWEAVDREPTPLEVVTLADLVQHLLKGLDPTEQGILELTLEGYTAREVAERLDRSERSVWRVREGVRARLRRLIDAGPVEA
jgi:DNA-directed RNA polymerase specialized sigma24 family protein